MRLKTRSKYRKISKRKHMKTCKAKKYSSIYGHEGNRRPISHFF